MLAKKPAPIRVALLCICTLITATGRAADWQPKTAPLMTRWAADVTPQNVHPEYPRPQMVREQWLNLNGLWDYAITPKEAPCPQQYDGQILVPFPIESALSGVMQRVNENQRLWYRRTFTVPAEWKGKRILLHFGAVDWEATVWVNGRGLKPIGDGGYSFETLNPAAEPHRGGYDAFTFDISDALNPDGVQEIVVSVWDPTDAGPQPRGKQVRNPHGIWYTPTTGIWQTVWLEPVPSRHIANLEVVTDVDAGCVVVRPTIRIPLEWSTFYVGRNLWVEIREGNKLVASASSEPGCRSICVMLPNAKHWSPENPFLYDLTVEFRENDTRYDPETGERLEGENGRTIDRVSSYFGLRKIALSQGKAGVTYILLNNMPYFMFGPLDQGFWPDGLYTAPTDEALRYDIEMTKKLGFNTARKHVKVEPQRWYYWCDKLGLLVWQDMPSGDMVDTGGKPEMQRTPASAAQFELELTRMIESLANHPCIVMWVPFNEGWGQYDTARIAELVRKRDPTRLVNAASGWHDMRIGDAHDIHVYPGPSCPEPEPARAAVLGEFGGLGLPLRGHTWLAEKSWGYRSFTTPAELTDAYVGLIEKLVPLVTDGGLSAAIYTQTSDVEIEVNGLMTYDRAVVKMDAERITEANRKVWWRPPVHRIFAP
jgi:beta-galactosidase/beta-glucuronidase